MKKAPSNEEIYDILYSFLESHYNIKVKEVILDKSNILKEMSSIDFISLIVNLEDKFNIEFEDSMLIIENYEDVNEFIKYIANLIKDSHG